MIQDYTFEVHPSVLFKLGEDLITDDYQALSELVKNSYDADATAAVITIDTQKYYRIDSDGICEADDPGPYTIRGRIEVKDNGCGMTAEDIERGWLTISSSRKRAMKEKGEKTTLQRTPLGDKGLGRLGAQRLGRVLELKTRAETNTAALRAVIDWSRFEGDKPLSQIKINVTETDSPAKRGTVLCIYGLKNLKGWDSARDIQNHFASIISPYSKELGFDLQIFVNDSPVDLRKQSRLAIDHSAIEYSFRFDGNMLTTKGSIDSRYLTDLRKNKKKETWNYLVGSDNGKSFMMWLAEKYKDKIASYKISYNSSGRFCNVSFSRSLSDIDGVERDESGQPFNPGSFSGQINYVIRADLKSDLKKPAELMESIKGVRVYRDGFGVRLKDSIIPFASQWTSGSSWYTLRPDNVLGFINLTAEGNPHLIETTDREEFIENQYYRNLKRLLVAWLRATEEVQSFLRRCYSAYEEEMNRAEANVVHNESPEEIANLINRNIDIANQSIDRQGSLFVDQKLDKALEELSKKKAAVSLLACQATEAEERLQQAWELVGLGIAAESVSHEIANISSRLKASANALIKINNEKINDSRIGATAELILSMAVALTKQVAYLDSSLKYVRDVRELFAVSEVVQLCTEHHTNRLENNDIMLNIVVVDDFLVKMNQGRLLQVIDNLIINSEYWLKEAKTRGNLTSPQITIEINRPYVLFSDNGIGIDQTVEHTLFDPFVSRKEKGRGLGLYIATQLLEADGSSISLLPYRNDHDRRYIFRIDLASVEEGRE